MVLEKTLESPLDCKEIQPVHSEGDQPWDFFGRNDAKAETPVTRQDSHIVTDLCCLADIPHDAAIHGVAKSRTRLSNCTELN